ncbi:MULTISPECIES: 1-acyl-sn-glycerol-3-phosphate acyltransferase [unclassified Rhodococcus (in: high G+C Gram-positive bacteria)]|uniref:lysophospholipid acyltransferase family protein n=1 Tax=Rhodococcus sp. SJ-3 TaxID=3454628 RepID=UPI003F7B2C5E
MTARAHAWMPASPCGEGCLPSASRRVAWPTVVMRAFSVVVLLACAPILAATRLAPASAREAVLRAGARGLLRCVGMRVTVTDLRDRRGYEGGLLVVAPHVSWVDVLVIMTVSPAGFVARADLLDWGTLGSLARRMRVIPIERERLRALPGVVDTVRTRLEAGERVAVFPEGTTWCGRAYGGFRSALFEAAIDAECPVQPIGFAYLDHTGVRTAAPAFVGEETIGASIARLVRSRGLVASVTVAPLEWPGFDRRDLAARCERAVRSSGRDGAPHLVRTAVPEQTPTADTEVSAPSPR